MKRVAEVFQKADWTTPGWSKAKDVMVALSAEPNSADLNFDQKIHLITLALQAATQSYDWVEFLIVVSDGLT